MIVELLVGKWAVMNLEEHAGESVFGTSIGPDATLIDESREKEEKKSYKYNDTFGILACISGTWH
jgi:hypothetical protein